MHCFTHSPAPSRTRRDYNYVQLLFGFTSTNFPTFKSNSADSKNTHKNQDGGVRISILSHFSVKIQMFQRFTHSIASCPFQTGDSFHRWNCNLGSFYCHDCNWSPKSRGLREWWGHLFGGHWKLCLGLSLFGRTWCCLLPNYEFSSNRCVLWGRRAYCKVSHPNLGKHHSFWWVILDS